VQFSRRWRGRVEKCTGLYPDLDVLHVHELRHTRARLLLRAGVHPGTPVREPIDA